MNTLVQKPSEASAESLVQEPAARQSQIGQRVPQHGAEGRVKGGATFTQDVFLPDMLFAAVLRSHHAHARITDIDISRAVAAEGVRSVITASDFPGIKYVHFGAKYSDRFPLANGVVRFVGEEVAAVAADTLEQARDAVRLITVNYETLPAVLDTEHAQKTGAPDLHVEALNPGGKNVAQVRDLVFGDVESAFESAERVFEDEYEHGVVVPCCMETNGTVASWDASGNLTLWTATQGPHFIRKEVAHVLGIPVEKVHIRGIEVGGGFGGKSKVCEQEAVASLLSIKTGRPVKLTLDRREEFLSGKTDHAKRMKIRTAIDAQGNILARALSVEFNNGAYTALAPTYMAASRARTTSLYRVGAAKFQSKIVYTNRVPGGQYRGMGAPQTIWAIESQIDRIAETMGWDPLEYRIQIANRAGDVTPLGWQITGCGLTECLREAARRIGWAEKRANPKPWRGVGIAGMIHPSAGTIYEEGNYSNTKIELMEGGIFQAYTQTSDTGTWQNTILAQLAAEALGVAHSLVTVRHIDTDAAPSDLGSAASRVTFVTGNSTIRAATELKAEILRRMAELWGCPESELSLCDDGVITRGTEDRKMTLRSIAERLGNIAAQGYYRIPTERPHPETGFGNYAAAYTFGAQAVEVEVDPATGKVTILKIVAVHDVGRPINPTALEGQIQGGILQGIGMALQEELVYEDSQPVNANFLNYKVPRIGDAPPIDVSFVHTEEHEGPFGAKAGGEPSLNPTVAAIANAIAHATGIRFTELPITPHRMLARIVEKQARKLPLHPGKRPYNLHVGAVRALYPAVVFPALRTVGTKFAKMPKPGAKPEIVRARDLDSLVHLMASGDAKVLAGGTDLMVGIQQGIYSPSRLVEIGKVSELRELTYRDGVLSIGAGMRLSEIAADALVRRHVPMLAAGIDRIATPQIRNMATMAGDLCQEKRCWFFRSAFPCFKNGGKTCPCFAVMGDSRHHSIMGAARCAAPCPADLAPMLNALDARVVVASAQGLRRIPMDDLYQWSGLTQLRADEIMLRIEIPVLPESRAAFEKFAIRKGDFAEASVSVRAIRGRGGLSELRIALGAVSPLPMRALETEKHILAHGFSHDAIREAAAKCVWGSLPLRDNAQKAHLVVGLAERALTAVFN